MVVFFLGVFCNLNLGQTELLKVNTDLVTVPFSVKDRGGRTITNIEPRELTILEDGVLQEIAFLNTFEEPITIVLLLDISSSMRDHYGSLLEAANSFVQELRPNDRLIVFSFHDRINMVIDLTEVKNVGNRIKLKTKSQGEGTILFDAVETGIKKLKRLSGRKALVLYTDGIGSGIATAKGTLRTAEESDAAFYTVQFGKFAPEPPPGGATKKNYFERVAEIEGYMRDLAVKTGGRHYHIEDITNLSATFHQIAEELSQQYMLGYYPLKEGKDGERRKITVKVNIPNVAVRSRNEVIFKKPKK